MPEELTAEPTERPAELAPQDDPNYFTPGLELVGFLAGHKLLCRVRSFADGLLVLEVRSSPGANRRWAFNKVPYGSIFRHERMLFSTAGGTRRTIRLRPLALLPDPAEADQADERQEAEAST